MSIHQKLSDARVEFHGLNLKKSGFNTYSEYHYFELVDFLIKGMEVLRNQGLMTLPVSFGTELATMTLIDMENGDTLFFTTPMSSAKLKACHEVQNLGAVQTYLRRYLWIALLEIVEQSDIDATEAEAPLERITEEQAASLRDRLSACDADEGKFCKWLKIKSLEDLPAQALSHATQALERKEKQA